jgi:hypothetical protein
VPSVLAAAYFALWACAPTAFLRAPLEPGGPRGAIGGAVVVSGMAHGELAGASHSTDGFVGADGQLWYQQRYRRVGFGADLAVGQAAFLSTGGYFRAFLTESPRHTLALDVNLGLRYAGWGLPFALHFANGISAYAGPSVSMREGPAIRLPIGMRLHLSEHVDLTTEAGLAALSPGNGTDDVQAWGALGLSFPFGAQTP